MKLKGKEKFFWVVLVIALQLFFLMVNNRNVDINYPINYDNGDVMGVFYYAKMIDEFGISLENPMTGGPDGSNMYDYPYSDTLSFAIVKCIGFFTDNPFLIINLFYFFSTILIAVTAYWVLRKRCKYSWIAVSLAILYANAPFVQFRYSHMWLIPYFMLPFECDIALDILDGKLIKENVPLWKNARFYLSVVIALLCSQTGLYYAFFACALFAIAMVIRIIRTTKLNDNMYPIVLILSTIIGCGLNYIPNLIYYGQNGKNPLSEVNIRSLGDCEYYGLKLVQMLLPRTGHRIQVLASLNAKYTNNYPLVTENNTASLGIVASLGLIIAFVWLFSKKANKSKSYLIVSIFLVATIGGLSSFISLFISIPMRCYNRMSLVVMFLALLCVAEFAELITDHVPVSLSIIAMTAVLFGGVFDQTVTINQADHSVMDSEKAFIEEIENNLDDGDFVFEMPCVTWPTVGNYRMFIGYLFSDNLGWSFGAMQGREESNWQQDVSVKPLFDMVDEIWERGYKGIYLDASVYESMYGEGSSQVFISELRQILGYEPIISVDGNLYFWGLEEYINSKGIEELEDAA